MEEARRPGSEGAEEISEEKYEAPDERWLGDWRYYMRSQYKIDLTLGGRYRFFEKGDLVPLDYRSLFVASHLVS